MLSLTVRDNDSPAAGVLKARRLIWRSNQTLLKIKRNINEILSDITGKPFEQIEKDTDRDYFMSPQEAKEYGLIDEIYSRRGQIAK